MKSLEYDLAEERKKKAYLWLGAILPQCAAHAAFYVAYGPTQRAPQNYRELPLNHRHMATLGHIMRVSEAPGTGTWSDGQKTRLKEVRAAIESMQKTIGVPVEELQKHWAAPRNDAAHPDLLHNNVPTMDSVETLVVECLNGDEYPNAEGTPFAAAVKYALATLWRVAKLNGHSENPFVKLD